jgi:hypothetical protein
MGSQNRNRATDRTAQRGGNPVDYALFLNRTECLLIEAKSLEKDLGDRK